MTPCEQDKLCAVIARHPGHPEDTVFFRDSQPAFGKGRASSRTEDGLAIASCVMARQTVFAFHNTKLERESRIVLGWESMLLCGFPTDIIGKMDRGKEPPFPDKSLQILAAHMLPVPVFMAIFLATLASVPWSHQVRNGEIADADDAANSFNADGGDAGDTEATLKHGMDELDSMRD